MFAANLIRKVHCAISSGSALRSEGRGGRVGWVFCLLFLTGILFARAQSEVTSVFIVPTQPLPANSPANLWLYSLNNSTNGQKLAFAPVLKGTLTSPTQTKEAVLTLNTNESQGEVTVAAGAFCKTEYTLTVPAGMQGQVRLDVNNYGPVLLAVAGETSVTNIVLGSPVNPPVTGTNAQVGGRLVGFLGNHFSPYEPIYFLLGSYPAAKFQISLKYQVFSFASEENPFSYLYFAYTQTSFWDLISRDPSFYDTSYKPSAFFYYPGISLKALDAKLDLQAGMEHESNGRGGVEERSLNTVYFQPTLKYEPLDDLTFTLQPRFWYYVSVGNNDKDLANYRGYGDLLASAKWKAVEVATKLRMGKNFDHAGWQFDLWFELPEFFRFNPALQVEYFTGYGQTLRQYNQTSWGIRGGLCLWY